MAVAVFNYAVWAARFPELAATVDQATATAYFAEATFLLDNTDCSIVQDVGQRLVLLNLITAHIAYLASPARAGAVGRISDATQGSVSTSLDYGDVSKSEAYWVQSPYGAQYWAMTVRYRTMQYRPGPRPFLGVPRGFGWPR